jgi:hypothetical protein
MTGGARQAAPLGPAAVAVHDDGNVQALAACDLRRKRRRIVLSF